MNMKKGQSAIEYLTTYGWAILAIVVVGAVVMQYVGSRCPENAQGFTGQDLKATQWAFKDNDNFQVTLRNQGGGDDITITNISVAGLGISSEQTIKYGNEKTITADVGSHGLSRGCYSENINITYDFVGGITGKKLSGTLNGKY